VRITQVQILLSLYGGASAARAEAIATALRSEGLLPKGGRGPYAPEGSTEEIVRFAFAAAAAPRVADAVEVAALATELVDHDGVSLSTALVDAISDEKRAFGIRRMVAVVTVPMAEIEERGGTSRFFFKRAMWEAPNFNPTAQGQGFAGLASYLGGAVLVQLAIQLHDDEFTGGYEE